MAFNSVGCVAFKTTISSLVTMTHAYPPVHLPFLDFGMRGKAFMYMVPELHRYCIKPNYFHGRDLNKENFQ